MAIGSTAVALILTLSHGSALKRHRPSQGPVEGGAAGMVAEAGAVDVTLKDIFCWAVQGPTDAYLMDLARTRLKYCGEYAVFANYTNELRNVVQVFDGDMQTGLTPGGWANNTDLFLSAWKFIARSPWPEQFQWFVKVDADTFFRPHVLPSFLSKFNPRAPVALVQDGRIRGALEVMSASSFRHEKASVLYTREAGQDLDPYLGGEDVWLGRAFQKAGFRLAETSLPGACRNFLLTYYNLPEHLKDGAVKTPGLARIIPPSLLTQACNGDYSSLESSHGDCVSRNVVAMHPVKDRSAYIEFMNAEDICTAA